MSMHIVNFFELSEVFTLKPQQAIDYSQNKGLKVSFSWLDMLAEENDATFYRYQNDGYRPVVVC